MRTWTIGLLVGLFATIGPRANQNPPDTASPELVEKARRFLDCLNRGDYAAAASDFDATMLQVAPPPKLAEFWQAVPGQLGAFKKQGDVRQEQAGAYDVILVTCEFEKVTLDARLVFDKDKKIAGFQFVPTAPSVPFQPPAYADTALFSERDGVVGGPEWPLPGTLAMPRGDGPFAAMVLVHGSGPNDRDETIGPNKPFKDLAWGLASRGIAVLRYEKRTRAHGSKMALDEKINQTLTVREETIDDALAAVRLLQAEPKIDRRRIFVLGHSLGGMLIPRIAEQGKGLGIAGFVIMAGLTRRLPETMLDQMTYLAKLDGTIAPDEQKQLEETQKAAAVIKNLKPGASMPQEKLLNAPPSYWIDLNGYDPAAEAKKVAAPLLVLQGGRDYQVKVVDFDNWRKALAKNPLATFKLYPKLNHLFAPGTGPSTPAEYMQEHRSVALEVVADIAAWIKGLLIGQK